MCGHAKETTTNTSSLSGARGGGGNYIQKLLLYMCLPSIRVETRHVNIASARLTPAPYRGLREISVVSARTLCDE